MPLVTSLVFGYKFEESTGAGTWVDVLATYDLTATGTITSATGIIGQAASGFTNATNYLTLASAPIGAAPYSVSCWVYFTAVPAGYLWAQSLLTVAKEFLRVNSGRSATVAFETASYSVIPTQSVWHHVVGVNDGTTVKLYYDGVLRASASAVAFVVSDAMSVGSLAASTVVSGRMDSVYGWSKALTDGSVSVGETAGGEVAQLYAAGAGLDYPFPESFTKLAGRGGLAGVGGIMVGPGGMAG